MGVIEKVYLKKIYVLRATFFGFLFGIVFGIFLYLLLSSTTGFTLKLISSFMSQIPDLSGGPVDIPVSSSSVWLYSLFIIPFSAFLIGIFSFIFAVVYNFISWIGAEVPLGLMDMGEVIKN